MIVEISVSIKLKDSIFIGGGSGTSGMGVDSATISRSDGCLIIPGSSFKGKLRSECERIARAFEEEVCLPPIPDNMCPHYFLKSKKETYYCVICKIFGSPWLRGSLNFSDLIWKVPYNHFSPEEWKKVRKTDIRPGVSISRYTKVKMERELFFKEVMYTGMDASFNGKITGNLGTNKELALLIAGLRTLLSIGGMKSRGLGRLEDTFKYERYQVISPKYDDSNFIEELNEWQKKG